MKVKFLIVLFILFGLSSYSQTFTEYYFKFTVQDKSEIETLTKIISIDKVAGNTVFAYATDKSFEAFKSLNYNYTLLTNLQKSAKADMAVTIAEMADWDKYPTYDVYVDMMNNYASSYPGICKVVNIGTTVNGRSLLALKITDNIDTEEDEPEFFYSSTMHGDETTGMILMLRLVDSLLTSYGTANEITNLIDSIEIYINPNANPDGTYAGGNSTIGTLSTRFNAKGVDLNRNFPDAVQGPHPDGELWQAETEAMMAFANEHHFVLSGNFHGGIELANYPWDCTSRRHADDNWFIDVSRNYATSCQNNSPAGYFDDENNGITNGADWYTVYGSKQDYFTYFHNGREITFEVSNTKIIAATSLTNYWNYNKQAIIDYMAECLHGIRGTVKNEDGNPLSAMIQVENHDTVIDSSMVFTDPEIGDYHRLISPGSYTLVASAIGFRNDTLKNITVTENQSTVANFVLTIDSISSEISPELINDTLNQGDSSQIYIVMENTGLLELSYNLVLDYPDGSDSWVSFEKMSGTITQGEKDSVHVTINSKALIPGNYISNITVNENDGNSQVIQVKLNVSSLTSSLTISPHSDVLIFPNPFSNQLTVNLVAQSNTIIDVSIFNVIGKLEYKSQFETQPGLNNKITIKNLENLPGGIYFIQLRSKDFHFTQKLIKQY